MDMQNKLGSSRAVEYEAEKRIKNIRESCIWCLAKLLCELLNHVPSLLDLQIHSFTEECVESTAELLCSMKS